MFGKTTGFIESSFVCSAPALQTVSNMTDKSQLKIDRIF